MKTIFTTLGLSIALFSYAQNPQLTETSTWYLKNLELPSETIDISELDKDVTAEFKSDKTLFTAFCKNLYGQLNYQGGTTGFNFQYLNNPVNNSSCNGDSNLMTISDKYIVNFYEENVFNNFAYTITSSGDVQTLVVTNAQGSKAIYTNQKENLSIDNNIASDNSFSISPNPAFDYLDIKTKESIKTVQIFSINGALIKQLDKPQTKISVENLKSGVYIINIQTENASHTQKFVKK